MMKCKDFKDFKCTGDKEQCPYQCHNCKHHYEKLEKWCNNCPDFENCGDFKWCEITMPCLVCGCNDLYFTAI